MKKFIKNKGASTSIEYGLIALLLSTVAGVSLGYSGDVIQEGVCSLSAKYNSAVYDYAEWDCSDPDVLADWLGGGIPPGGGTGSSSEEATTTLPPYVGTPEIPSLWSEVEGTSYTASSPLYATWNEFNLFGSPTNRYNLTADSPYLETTLALRPAPSVDCSPRATFPSKLEDYCFIGLRTVDINTSSPNYDGSPIIIGAHSGQKVAFVNSQSYLSNLINSNNSASEINFSMLQGVSYFNPRLATSSSYSGFTSKVVRIDGNGNEVSVLNDVYIRENNKFKLEDGIFKISYPFVVNGSLYNNLYNEGGDLGKYHYIPSGNSTVYLYNEGINKYSDKHQIEWNTIDWSASCEVDSSGDDKVVMTEIATGTTATFIFVNRQTFDPLNPNCNSADVNTFVQ